MFINKLRLNIKNIPGWKTNRKIVLFESDDWGSNRIASTENYRALLNMGVPVDQSAYNRYDTIERSSDLEALFDILRTVRDKNGRHAVFTAFVNPANPDFQRIKESSFENYYYETFDVTLNKYGEREKVLSLYREGIDSGIFEPQFHGREHLAVLLWMKFLKNRNGMVRSAFDQNFYACPEPSLNEFVRDFRPGFYFESNNEIPFLREVISEGMDLFESLMGYRAKVFAPPNGIFPSKLEKDLLETGIQAIVTTRVRREPIGNGVVKKKIYGFGKVNKLGQTYYIRNCQFEPYDNRSVNRCIEMMKAAFKWGKPAIICTHRVNFNGGIDETNRNKGLKELKELLIQMLKKWPDIEFMSSGEFAKIIKT